MKTQDQDAIEDHVDTLSDRLHLLQLAITNKDKHEQAVYLIQISTEALELAGLATRLATPMLMPKRKK